MVAETCFLLARSGFDPALALPLIERGVVQLPFALQEQISTVPALFRRYQDERIARLADAQLQALPIHWVPASDPLLEQAAAFMACHPLSVADAWIAAAAHSEGAVLVHKDPEFRSITGLAQGWLG